MLFIFIQVIFRNLSNYVCEKKKKSQIREKKIDKIHASVRTIQVGFDIERRRLADVGGGGGGGLRFSGAGAPLPAAVASNLTVDNDALTTTAIFCCSLSYVSIAFNCFFFTFC